MTNRRTEITNSTAKSWPRAVRPVFSRAACYTTRFLTLAAQCPHCCPQRSTKIYSRKSMMLMTCKRKCVRCRQCSSAKPAFAHKPIEQNLWYCSALTHTRTNAHTHATHARAHTHIIVHAATSHVNPSPPPPPYGAHPLSVSRSEP